MKDYQKEYKEEYAKALKENFSLVRKQLKNKDVSLMNKIQNRADGYGIPAIIKEECDTAIIPFVKNPSKQNFYEKTTMIENMRGIKNFHKLSIALFMQSTYVCNGSIIERTELRIYAKTIDFRWEYKGYKIYNKYTKGSGGSNTKICKNLSNKVENYPKQFLSR